LCWEEAPDLNDCDGISCGNGSCNDLAHDYSCTCDAGYTGTHCQTDINECASVSCFNGSCNYLVN
jgi:Notch-like protein